MCKRYIARACVNFVFSDCVVSSRPFPYLPPQKGELRTYKYHCGIDFWVRKLNILATAVLFFVWRSGRAEGGATRNAIPHSPICQQLLKKIRFARSITSHFRTASMLGTPGFASLVIGAFRFSPRTDIDGSIYGFRLIRFNRDIKN